MTEQTPGSEALEGQNPSAPSALPRAEQEDWDAAPSVEVQATPRKQATSLLVDPVSYVLWVGDKDGWVTGGWRAGVALARMDARLRLLDSAMEGVEWGSCK